MHKLAAGAAAASCLLLCSCAATVTLPVVDLATSETAATQESSSMGLVLPQTDTSIPVWLAYAALQATPENAFFLPDTVQLNVENILQNPELPNGCEITSAAIVLNYLGFDIDKVTLAENCLPMHIPYWEADPEVEFMGSPADELSFYCLPGVITTAVNTYLDEQGSTYSALDITGAEPARLRCTWPRARRCWCGPPAPLQNHFIITPLHWPMAAGLTPTLIVWCLPATTRTTITLPTPCRRSPRSTAIPSPCGTRNWAATPSLSPNKVSA